MLREKHRSAQRRYRERLRAKHEEADHRVEQLTRELDQLKAAQVHARGLLLGLEAHSNLIWELHGSLLACYQLACELDQLTKTE